jgi:cell division protein FtsL
VTTTIIVLLAILVLESGFSLANNALVHNQNYKTHMRTIDEQREQINNLKKQLRRLSEDYIKLSLEKAPTLAVSAEEGITVLSPGWRKKL